MCVWAWENQSYLYKKHILLMDVTASYTCDVPFHTDKTAIDDHVCFSRWLISDPIKCIATG